MDYMKKRLATAIIALPPIVLLTGTALGDAGLQSFREHTPYDGRCTGVALPPINGVPYGSIPDVQRTDACYDAMYKLYRAGIFSGYTELGEAKPA